MEKGQISALQMSMLMYPTVIATALLSVPSYMYKYAKQDLWLSSLWASLIGFLGVYVVIQLHKLFPQQTFSQICEQTIGVFSGKLLGFVYFYFFVLITGQLTRPYAEFMKSIFYPETPLSVIMISMLVLAAFTVKGGIEVIGRVSQLFFPIFFFSIFMIIIMIIPQLRPANILPLLENGVAPSLKGAIIPQGWFGEFFLMIFLLPFLKDGKKAMKWGMITVLFVLLTFIATNLSTLFLLGTAIEGKLYPFFLVARMVSIGAYIESFDPIILAAWILGAFVKITVFYYVTVLGTAQWLNLSDYKPIIWPIGILIMALSFWSFPNLMTLNQFDVAVFPILGFLMQTLIPLLILGIAIIKKKFIRK